MRWTWRHYRRTSTVQALSRQSWMSGRSYWSPWPRAGGEGAADRTQLSAVVTWPDRTVVPSERNPPAQRPRRSWRHTMQTPHWPRARFGAALLLAILVGSLSLPLATHSTAAQG